MKKTISVLILILLVSISIIYFVRDKEPAGWNKAKVSEDRVIEELSKINQENCLSINKDLRDIDIWWFTDSKNENRIKLYLKPETVNDLDSYTKLVANTFVHYSEVLFTNKNIEELMIETYINFDTVDEKVIEDTAFILNWFREDYESADIAELKSQVKDDYTKVFEKAAKYEIHKFIYDKLMNKKNLKQRVDNTWN